jgi:hypothetical protein
MFRVAWLLVLAAGPLACQCSPPLGLVAPPPNNGQSGVMFDMEPTGGVPLRIESFDIVLSTTASSIYEVWVRPPLQSHVGFTTSPAGWTLLGTTAPFVGAGATVPVPMNLCLGYILQVGGRTGFYITLAPSGGSNLRYTNGVAVGAITASDTYLTVYDGNGGTYFNMTFAPRNFSGVVRYGFGNNILTMGQSGPGVGDFTMSLGSVSPGATRGWTLISQDVSGPVGLGPLLGIRPDATTWELFFTVPMLDGSPFHFPVPSPSGGFPNIPIQMAPGSVNSLAGITLDAACLLVDGFYGYIGHSNVVRMTFQ